jgi:hypothetical protein
VRFHLQDAEFFLLYLRGADARLAEVGLLELFILDDFIKSLVDCRNAVFQSVHDLYADYAREALQEIILSDERVIAVMENATATSPYWVDLEDRWTVSEALWSSVDRWRFEVFGIMDGRHLGTFSDPENAHEFEETGEIHCDGWLEFAKAGRAGLKLHSSGAKAE